MSTENTDHFMLWEDDFSGIDLPKNPNDPLDGIIKLSTDPIACAKELQSYVLENPVEAHSLLIRRGLAKLAYKHYGPYHGKQVAVAADIAFGIPEANASRRKRNVLHASQYQGQVFAIGKLATFEAARYRIEESGDERALISLRISEPHLVNNVGEINTEHELPDYMLFPIPSVLSYKFKNSN